MGWLMPPHSSEMRSISGLMSLPGTSAASGDAVLQEVEVDGTFHQAKGGHQDERSDGEDDAAHHPHAHPIRSSDQRLVLPAS